MQVRNHGKYTKMLKNNPRAIGRCDYSGLMVQQLSMKDQYQYAGQGLVKTGYRVSPKFYDQPNPQNLTPLIKLDPVPIIQARPDNEIDAVQPQVLFLDISGNSNIVLTLDQFRNSRFIFTGALTGNVIVFVPGTFNDFFVENRTTGGFTLFMQISNNSASIVTLIPNTTMLICCDGYTLHILNQTGT